MAFYKKRKLENNVDTLFSSNQKLTRTGFELIPSILVVFSKMRKWLYFADF